MEQIPIKASPKDRAGVGKERSALFAFLDQRVPGFAAAWDEWRAVLPARQRGTAWADVLKLRDFAALCSGYSPAQILDMLKLARDRGWRGFSVVWWEAERARRPRQSPDEGAWGQLKEADQWRS